MMRNRDTSPSLKCPSCGTQHSQAALEEKLYICPSCSHYFSMPSRARIATLADTGTFRELDRKLVSIDFLGGTMGSVVGEKIANAFEEATERRVPVVSVAASGGARVQEGMLSLMQMAKVAAAVSLHDRERLAFISVLTDPTFGGVTASFASLGDVILAEPGAQIGFVGPRVIEQTTGVAPPKDSHHAETLLRAGLIDLVVKRENLPRVIGLLINHLRKQKANRDAVEPS